MKKLIYILLGFCANAFAQNPVLNKMTYYTTDANNKDSVLCEDYTIDEPYSFDFRGKTGTVVLPNNGGKSIKMNKENVDVYCYVPEFVDYDRKLEVRVAVSPDLNFVKAGIVVAKKPITDLNSEKWKENNVRTDLLEDPVFGRKVICEDLASGGFSLKLVTEVNAYRYELLRFSDFDYKGIVVFGIPEYCTDYYIRPYLITKEGDVMFGTEKKFSSLNTMMGAILNQENVYARVGNTLITKDAIRNFAREHKNLCANVLSSDSCLVAFAKDFAKYLQDNKVPSSAFETNIASVNNCIDGTLSYVDELPNSIKTDYWNSFKQDVKFDLINDIYWGCDKRSADYTRNIIRPDYSNYSAFDPAWGVGEGLYVNYVLVKSAAVPYITYEVPRYLLPGKYKLYVTVVTPPETTVDKFKVNLYEATDKGELNYVVSPNYSFEVNDSYNFIPDSEKIVDTICIGEYEFGGYSKNLIQIVPARKYAIKIAEIKLVPVNL